MSDNVYMMHASIGWQIYGDSTASSKDCFKMFNPTDITTFNVSYTLCSILCNTLSFLVCFEKGWLKQFNFKFRTLPLITWFCSHKILQLHTQSNTFTQNAWRGHFVDDALSLLCVLSCQTLSHIHFELQRVLNDWSAAFFTLFSLGGVQIEELHPNATGSGFEKWVSIDDYLNGYLMERKSRYGKKMEVLELGMQEIRTYFRLFLLSSVLLMFMFCSRISKSGRQIVSAMSLWFCDGILCCPWDLARQFWES